MYIKCVFCTVCIVIVDISKNQLSGIFTLFSCAYPQYVECGGAVVRAPALEFQGFDSHWVSMLSTLGKLLTYSWLRFTQPKKMFGSTGVYSPRGIRWFWISDDSQGSYCKTPLKSTHKKYKKYTYTLST